MSTAVALPVARAPSRSPTAILVGKLFRRKLVLAGAAILVVVTLLAVFAPWITPYGPMAMKISDRLQSPRLAHWFGTDELGRDVFSRVVFGARYSLMIGASVVLISVTGGVLLGLTAGFFRRFGKSQTGPQQGTHFRGSQIAGHKDHGAGEIDPAVISQRERGFVEHTQQQVP